MAAGGGVEQVGKNEAPANRGPGAPFNYLAPLTPQQITQQATQTVAAAYKPVYGEINSQISQQQAIDAKRAQDNQYYNQWLAQNSASLQNAALNFDQSLQARGQQTQDMINQAFGQSGVPTQLAQGMTNRINNVSNPALDTSMNTAVQGAKNFAQETVGGQNLALNRSLQSNANSTASTYANNLGIAAANEAKRVSDSWAAMAKLADTKQQAILKQGADTANAISKGLTQEINKANANRNYAAAVAKLGLGQYAAQTGRINAQNNINRTNIDAQHYGNQDQLGKGRLNLEQQKAALDQWYKQTAVSQRAQQMQIDWYKARNTAAGTKGSKLTKDQQATGNSQYAFDNAYSGLGIMNVPVRDSQGHLTYQDPAGKVPKTTMVGYNNIVRAAANNTGAAQFNSAGVPMNRAALISTMQKTFGVNQLVANAAVDAYVYAKGNVATDPTTLTGPISPYYQRFLTNKIG